MLLRLKDSSWIVKLPAIYQETKEEAIFTHLMKEVCNSKVIVI